MTFVLAPEREGRTGADIDLLDLFRTNPRSRQPAVLVRHDGSEHSVVISEFTTTGFRLSVTARPALGEDVRIRLPGKPDLRGKIRWAHATEAGGSF